jgi:hypothetical protein
MVNYIDMIVAFLFLPPVSIGIMIFILGIVLWRLSPLLPFLKKWAEEIHISDEGKERSKVASINSLASYDKKILRLHMEGKSTQSVTLGTITGWSAWKPKYIIMRNDPKKEITDEEVEKEKKKLPPTYDILFYKPLKQGLIDALFGKKENLVYLQKQIKYINDREVVLWGDSIEPYLGGYRLLVISNTPVIELSLAMSFEKANTILDMKANQLKKLIELAMRINPNQRSALELGSPRIDVPVPAQQLGGKQL